jgi:hypothetical protein
MRTKFVLESLKKRDQSEDLGVGGRIILRRYGRRSRLNSSDAG